MRRKLAESVHFENFSHGEKLNCDRAEYNTESKTGKFYNVSGTSPARIESRPGLLTTQNPFYFSGEWAEKTEDRYLLHDGFLTDCLIPAPWWRLKGPIFDVIPGDRAVSKGSWFYVKEVPIFYAPYFYKSLKKQPRRSGFLTPSAGNSSLRGKTVGVGYFWAINRSYDLTYRGLFYSQTGFGHQADFRGVVSKNTYFDVSLYGITSSHANANASAPSGLVLSVEGKSDIGKGWEARGDLKYLSSFLFRQQFTQSFDEAVSSETHSVGYITKHWSDYGFSLVAQRNVNFQSTAPNDAIVLRKLPEVQFTEREHQIRKLPVWFSLDSSFGLERRTPARVSDPPAGAAGEFRASRDYRRALARIRPCAELRSPRNCLRFQLHRQSGDRRQRGAFRPRCFPGRILAAAVGHL